MAQSHCAGGDCVPAVLIQDPTPLYMYEEGSPEGKRPQESAKGPGPELGPRLALITNP